VAGLVLAAASAMAHDLYVGVIKGDHASPQEQVVAARISSLIVGVLAIYVGIAAEGQNVAHLVALAFAVAASSNLPAVFLTLYWKRCNTYGIVLGMLVGAISAIALVMVSPNLTYPKAVVKDAKKVLQGEPAQPAKPAMAAVPASSFACELFALQGCVKAEPAKPASPEKPAKLGGPEKLAQLQEKLPALTDAKEIETAKKDIGKLEKDIKKAQENLQKMGDQATSLMGLEKPFFLLKNPGLISIPLGFLVVILGSLLFRDKRAEDMWDELYVRQNTGINAEGAAAH